MNLVLERYSWALNALLVVLAAYLAARTVNTLASAAIATEPVLEEVRPAPQAPFSSRPLDLDGDKVARLFNVPFTMALPIGTDTRPLRSRLHGTLVGTAVVDPIRYSLCQILDPDRDETQVYAIGEMYQGARIDRIERDRVLLDHEGVAEYIDGSGVPRAQREPGDGVRQLSRDHYAIARSELSRITLDSFPDPGPRIIPSFKNGVADGFKLFSITPDSLYAKIGIQNGDVIRRINGYELNSLDKALEIYQKLRNASRIEIEIDRRGEILRKSYSIE